jgi:competence protein ComEA
MFGMTISISAIKRLIASSETLQCFCPSCPDTAFAEKGALGLGFIKVDIQGAVKKPGIYQLAIGQRIADLVASASGFTQDADPLYLAKNLNLATELKDQDKVYIPFLAEKNDESEDAANQQEDSSSTNKSLISINQASLNELQTLSGIGVVKAQAIVDQRPYSNLDELVSKKVISENLLNDLRAQLTL